MYTSTFTVAVSNISKIARTNCFGVIFFFFVSVFSFAQPKFKIFDTESGLSNNSITSIVQDHSAYLWVGTENGLNRFDGNSFKVFKYSSNDSNSISNNVISSLAVDNFNRIWIGHQGGITRYDQAIHKFTRYRARGRTTFISVDKNNRIWVGIVGGGLMVLNPETGAIEKKIDLTPFINKNYNQREIHKYNTINGMVEDLSGNVWLATHDGLYVYNRKLNIVKPIRVVEDSPGKHRDDFFKGILDDKQGGFWLSSYRGGVCHYSPKENLFSVNQITLKEYDTDKDIGFTNTVTDIAWKSEKELWLVTWGQGKSIGTFDIQTSTFSFLKLSDIFGSEIAATSLLFSNVFVDHKNVVWASSRLGLVMINPKNSLNIKSIFKVDSTKNWGNVKISISDIVEDTIVQKKFLGTYYGPGLIVSDMKGNNVRTYKGRVNLMDGDFEYIQDLMNASGNLLWVVSKDNIRLFDKVKEKWVDLPELQKLEMHTGSVSPSFYRIIKASSGDYWIATQRNGAYVLCASDLSFVNFKRDPHQENSICSNSIQEVVEDKFGRIWFASKNSGISILDPQSNTFKKLSREEKGSSLLPTNGIYDMDIDSHGNVWLATVEVGIIKINVISKDSLNTVTFDSEPMTNPVTEIKIDGQDRVWFRSFGIHMLDPKTMNVKFFENGFDFDYALFRLNNHVLVNGTNGIGLINEKDLLPDTTSSPLVINSIKVFGKEIYPQEANHDHIELPHDQNSLAIDFATIDFLNGKKTTYSYKLEGLKSSEWTSPSSNRFTEFANLPGGDFVFKLKTSNHEGIWSKEKNLLYIHVETPFWKTKWFYASLFIIGIGIIMLIYWYQINRIRKREEEKGETKKRISQLQLKALHTQMRPHFIFNCLSAINGHIVKLETAKATEFLSQFSRLMRGILENSTESWITLEQEVETLRLYLKMEGLRFEDKFSCQLEVEEGIHSPAILIPSMIIQPYVENAIDHGLLHKEEGTGTVSIKFLKGDGHLKCIIEDNGIGRERSKQIRERSRISRKSLGLQITSERLQLLQGSSVAEIQDLKNESGEPTGTRIIIMLMTKKAQEKELTHNN